MSEPRCVFILIHDDYAAGGLQRSALAIRECLEAQGYEATIYCVRATPGGLAEKHSFVVPVSSVRSNKLLTWLTFFRALRRLLRDIRPVAAIGVGVFPAVALPIAAAGYSNIALIGSERAYPPATPQTKLVRLLRRLTFPRLDCLVCQTGEIARWFEQALGIPADRLAIIPNLVRKAPDGWVPTQFEAKDSRQFVAAGRLERQKGYDFALRAFARVAAERPEASLVIVGEGGLHQQLLALRAELNLQDRVEFRAPVTDLEQLWREAYALLFTSRYEGFPNVLAEAMAHGVPAVAFDCPTGPSELIDDGRNGFLVPLGDVDAAATRCVELVRNPSARDSMGQAAMAVADQYSFDRIAGLWGELLARATRR